jgi:hypothetical protein
MGNQANERLWVVRGLKRGRPVWQMGAPGPRYEMFRTSPAYPALLLAVKKPQSEIPNRPHRSYRAASACRPTN